MFIRRKRWKGLAERVKSLENEVDSLKRQMTVKSWSYGEVTFGDYVKITEKEISRLKEACRQLKAADDS